MGNVQLRTVSYREKYQDKKLKGAYSGFGQHLRLNLVLAEKKPSVMFYWKSSSCVCICYSQHEHLQPATVLVVDLYLYSNYTNFSFTLSPQDLCSTL